MFKKPSIIRPGSKYESLFGHIYLNRAEVHKTIQSQKLD